MIKLVNAPMFNSQNIQSMLKAGMKIMVVCSTLLANGMVSAQGGAPSAPWQERSVATTTERTQPTYGGTLVWGTVNAPTLINPVLTSTSVSSSLVSLLFDSLVRLDHLGRIVPGIAQSWDVSEDGREYTFYLHQNITFHDGHPLTAEDIKFTFDLVQDPTIQSPWISRKDNVSTWENIDPYTIRIRLREPSNSVPYVLTREIIPKHIFENEDIRLSRYNYAPVGSGPYKFNSWDPKTNQIELDANQDYFEGRPYIDRIVVKSYEDNTQLWTALMRNDVDMVLYLNPNDYQILKADETFTSYEITWEMYLGIAYNLTDPILNNLEMRRIIAKSVDRQAILDQIGMPGRLSNGPFHPLSIGFNSDVEAIPYNPSEAVADLEKLGWSDLDYDGIRLRDGEKLVLRMLIDENDRNYLKIAQVLRQQLSAVGIRLEVILYKDESQLSQKFLEENKPQAWLRFFDGTGHGYSGNGSLTNWFVEGGSVNRLWKYSNDRVQELFDQGRDMTDPVARGKVFKEIHQIIYDSQPVLFMYFPTTYHAVSSRVQNTDKFFTNNMPVDGIKEWYINSNSN